MMGPSLAADVVQRLYRLDCGLLSDVLEESGLPNQTVSSSLVPLTLGSRFSGVAACVRGEPIVNARHSMPEPVSDTFEKVAVAGSVLIIGTGATCAGACIGGLVAYSLLRAGCAGLITDTPVRDASEIRELGFPVFSTGVTPINRSRRWHLVAKDIPVSLPGESGAPVQIYPGDLILADMDGIVVIPAKVALQVVEDSEELQRIEQRIAQEMRGGTARSEAMKRNPRFQHVRAAIA